MESKADGPPTAPLWRNITAEFATRVRYLNPIGIVPGHGEKVARNPPLPCGSLDFSELFTNTRAFKPLQNNFSENHSAPALGHCLNHYDTNDQWCEQLNTGNTGNWLGDSVGLFVFIKRRSRKTGNLLNLSVRYGERVGITKLILLPTPFRHLGMILFLHLCVLSCLFLIPPTCSNNNLEFNSNSTPVCCSVV